MKRNVARNLRKAIELGSQSLPDDTALEASALFPSWASGAVYAADQRVRYGGVLYRCLQGHTSQSGWMPAAAPSLWAKVLIPDADMIPAWEQPGSTNPYMQGDKVTHNGKTWVSTLDNNVWAPGVFGWDEV